MKEELAFQANMNVYDQKMPQSQSADQPTAPWVRDTEQKKTHYDLSWATCFVFFSKMIDIKNHTTNQGPLDESPKP